MTKGLSRAGFDLDLLDGQHSENQLRAIFDSPAHLIEVKSDEKSRSTGNLFLEYRQKGRPSGIAITQADWWAFETYPSTYIIVPTHRLLALARQAWNDQNRRRRGGDFDNYEGVLLPISRIVPVGREQVAA